MFIFDIFILKRMMICIFYLHHNKNILKHEKINDKFLLNFTLLISYI